MKKIPKALTGYVGWALFFIDLNAYAENTYAFWYVLKYTIPSDVYVIIEKGRHHFRGTRYNALYWTALRE